MSKTKEELRQYAIKMRERGDTLYEIRNYLVRNTSDVQIVQEIIESVGEWEESVKENTIQKKKKIPVINLLLGTFLIISGIVLVIVLWKQGFIAILPIILIVIGIAALTSPNFNQLLDDFLKNGLINKTRY